MLAKIFELKTRVNRQLSLLCFVICLAWSISTSAQDVYDLGWYNNPSREHYYVISTKEEFSGLAYACNTLGDYFEHDTIVLQNDLDVSEAPVITSFSGYLDGQNHSLTNSNKNIFANLTSKSTIANLVTRGNISTNVVKYGIYAINCEGCIIGCTNYVDLSVSNSNEFSYVGAFCSTLNGGVIVNCTNYGTVRDNISGSSYTYVQRCGGVVGQANNARLIHVSNYGAITASGYCYVNCGGIVGDLQNSSVWDCNNFGTITSSISPGSQPSNNFVQNTGGIVGLSQGSSSSAKVNVIDACRNEGKVTSNTYLVAGIVGHTQYTHIINCINNGEIRSTKYYYFSCANGICSCYEGKQTYFANCINTGNIVSESNGYIATAGGTCSDINNAIVANLMSTGSVSASAPGSSKFQIDNYEASESTIDNVASDITAMNAYNITQPYAKKDLQLLLWGEMEDSIYLQPFHVSMVRPSQGQAAIHFYSSQDIEQSYQLTYSSSPDDSATTTVYENYALIESLKPATEYSYTLQANLYDESLPQQGTFTTLPLEFNTTERIDDENNLHVVTAIVAEGVNVSGYGYQYKAINDDQWKQVDLQDSFVLVFDAEPVSHTYMIKPHIQTKWGMMEGPTKMIEIPHITPSIELTNVRVNSMQVVCSNYFVFNEYDWGITINNRYLNSDSISIAATRDGVFEFKNLSPGGYYDVYYYININGAYYKELLTGQSLKTEELEAPLYISPTAFMIKFLYANTSSSTSVKFETRDLFADPLSASASTSAEALGNGEFYATLNIAESGLTQYRYVINKNTYGDWFVVNNQDATCEYVPTLFLYLTSETQNNNLIVKCKKVQGEQPATDVGFQYKFDFQSSFYTLPLSNKVDLSLTLSNLVAGYKYVGRFYCTTAETTYYSDEFEFSTNGIENILTGINKTMEVQSTKSYKIFENSTIYIINENKKYNIFGGRVQ